MAFALLLSLGTAPEHTSVAAAAGIGIGAGLLMGFTMAAITGWFLMRMVGER